MAVPAGWMRGRVITRKVDIIRVMQEKGNTKVFL
jgi:hypothetical protein